MRDIRFLDETFDINSTGSYSLSIQAGADGLSYTIFSPLSYKYLVLKHFNFNQDIPDYKYPDHLVEIFSRDEFLSKDFQQVLCIWRNQRSTLLPAILFDETKLKIFFEFNHILNDLEEIHTNHLQSIDAKLIFPIHHEIANAFIRQFPGIRFFNQASPLIEYSLKNSQSHSKSVYVCFDKKFFDIILVRDQQLLFHNTFSYRGDQDIIYFILNVYDKFQLDPGSNPVFLSGMIEKKSPGADIIRKFIKTVHFAAPDDHFNYSHSFSSIPEHWFINLFNLYHCA